jgi:hypothetical protein
MSLNWHTKKIYILRGKMPTKSLKKIILCVALKDHSVFLQTKAYKSKTKINFSNFFLIFQRRSIHVPPKKKAKLYLYSKRAFLQQN